MKTMPKAKAVVMQKLDPKDLTAATIRKAIKDFEPFKVVDGELVNSKHRWAIVYTAPLGGDRKVMYGFRRRSKATKLRDIMSEVWVLGRTSQKMVD